MADEEKQEQQKMPDNAQNSGISDEEALIEQQMLAMAEEEEKKKTAEVQNAKFEEFKKNTPTVSGEVSGDRIEMLMDIILPVSIELGRTKMFIKDILDLERGSIVEIDKLAGEPVDLLINNKKMAEGEVVVVEKHFGIRITNLIDPRDRIKNLGG